MFVSRKIANIFGYLCLLALAVAIWYVLYGLNDTLIFVFYLIPLLYCFYAVMFASAHLTIFLYVYVKYQVVEISISPMLLGVVVLAYCLGMKYWLENTEADCFLFFAPAGAKCTFPQKFLVAYYAMPIVGAVSGVFLAIVQLYVGTLRGKLAKLELDPELQTKANNMRERWINGVYTSNAERQSASYLTNEKSKAAFERYLVKLLRTNRLEEAAALMLEEKK